MAPEILLSVPYNVSVDLWSIGCLLYMLIVGYPPFQATNHRELFRKVRSADFIFHEKYWKNVSVAAKQLISGLLTVNSTIRWNATTALQCDWFIKVPGDRLSENDLSGSISEMRKFRPVRKWKSIVKAVGWCSMAPFWNPDAISFSQQLTDWDKKLVGSNEQDAGTADGVTATTTASATTTPGQSATSCNSVVSKHPRIKFADVYELKTKLRKGSYATVWEGIHKQSEQIIAVKVIERKDLQPKDDEAVLNEVATMQSLAGFKYTVQLVDFYEEDDYFYLVMEYMAGGDVFDRIVKMTTYTEKDARDLTLVLLKAVNSMHKEGIAHRDIKPQNLMLSSKEDNASIKVGDFGFARRVHTPSSLTTRVGTPTYVAPEILKNMPHDQRVDLWSIGVVVFVLLVGYPPFLEEKQADLFLKIRTGDFSFVKDDWLQVSEDAKDLIKGLLKTDPKERWSLEEALRCKWINQDPDQLSSIDLGESVRSLKERRGRLRSLARAFMWMGKDNTKPVEVKTQAQDLASQAFEKLKAASTSAATSTASVVSSTAETVATTVKQAIPTKKP